MTLVSFGWVGRGGGASSSYDAGNVRASREKGGKGEDRLEFLVLINNLDAMLVAAIGGLVADGGKVIVHDVVGRGAVAGEYQLGNGGVRSRSQGRRGAMGIGMPLVRARRCVKYIRTAQTKIARVQWETQKPRRESVEEAEGSRGNDQRL